MAPNNLLNIDNMSIHAEEKKDSDADMIHREDSDSEEVNSFLKKLGTPGAGWSNGHVKPQMFPLTRNGRLELYSANRRWIGLNKGWSRVGGDEGDGKTTDQYSHRTRRSSQMKSLMEKGLGNSTSLSLAERQRLLGDEALAVRSLIAQLCEQYYRFGWATGTAGGVSIRVGGPSENRPWRVFVAPSGIQKGEIATSKQHPIGLCSVLFGIRLE
jgi:hypothetical protein